jgi:ketosteroid isomerase-like protein
MSMAHDNANLIRRAYQAYANGDLAGMLDEVTGSGELVMVGVRTPGGRCPLRPAWG